MGRFSPRFAVQIYVLLALLAAAILSPLPYSLLALALLVLLLVTSRPLPPRFSVAITVATIFLAPLALTPLALRLMPAPPAAPLLAAALTLPLFYLLDDSLRQNARRAPAFLPGRTGRHTTYTLVSLLAAAVVIMLLSPVAGSPALLFTGIALALYLLGALLVIRLTIPPRPLTLATTRKRVIAGTTAGLPLYLTSRARVGLHSRLTPAEPWVEVSPARGIVSPGKTRLDLSLTPPLAGPSCPVLRVAALDPRGLVQINQVLEPLEVHVIPRAKYAAWLAEKYLDQLKTGVVTATALPPQNIHVTRRGVEYHESRTYRPGDQMKDIDWKHTLKLSQIIVREYAEAGEQAAIIAVNLAVGDAEEGDKLAFNMLTAALTLARENIPAALAAYDHLKPVLTTTVTSPLEILKKTLELVREITVVGPVQRRLEPSDIARIRRNMAQLQRSSLEPAQRLLGLLDFEHRAIEEAARNHPATLTLASVTKGAPTPAMILLVSPLNHDAEAVLVTAEKLARRKFTLMPVDATL